MDLKVAERLQGLDSVASGFCYILQKKTYTTLVSTSDPGAHLIISHASKVISLILSLENCHLVKTRGAGAGGRADRAGISRNVVGCFFLI